MEYDIVYTKRKSLALHIQSAKLLVKAPYATDKSRIEDLVKRKQSWIEKQIKKQSQLSVEADKYKNSN